jgi:alkanesulfonate monooxygenase SsuD/methylene tetrahydromethanopterin reductase-like flavin-dependent oxidoreductase (luciferase family)
MNNNIKFGLRIPTFPINDSRGRKFVEEIINFLKEIGEYFDSGWVDDHFVPWATFLSPEVDHLECWTTISYLSGIFSKMKFGSIVLCNSYRNPALVAKMSSTLNVLTNGRFILGIGAGWKEDEYIAYGYDFPKPYIRIKQLEEAVQIIKLLWSKDNVTFNGKYYKIKNAYCNPKPITPIPLMIGGGGEKLTLKVVAKYADWWNLANPTLEEYRRKAEILREYCEKVGRDYNEIKKTIAGLISIAENYDKAYKFALESPYISKENIKIVFVGDPDTIIEKIIDFVSEGVEYFIFRFLDFPKTNGAKIFIEKVMTEFE